MTKTPEVRADMDPDMPVPPGVDPNVPSPARMYDYYLGGTHNYQCDRDAAERIRAQMPDLQDAAWANRGFHQRAAKWIAEQGIRQFIDIGSGLPTVGNTHEVVQKVHPDARVVYVDNDPIVAAHAAELLAGSRTATLIQADLRDPGTVLGDREMRELIDVTEPTGLLMTAVVHFVADDEDPWGLLARYIGALAPGSYLALSHVTYEGLPPRTVRAGRDEYARATQNIHLRSRADIARFFSGLELVPPYEGADPAVAHVGLWGAEDPELADSDGSRAFYCGVARRP
ncbi:MAG TPA: SAM-dependent methyltransferase [Streptosporangiaceae bacterium]|nr:SAM-dependent methyltransferase [Streptosporangiaceae bacterium]